MKATVFDLKEWNTRIWPQVVADHGEAVRISWVCKERLGFTVRVHTDYSRVEELGAVRPTSIHLDFYDEASRTMFLLKYA